MVVRGLWGWDAGYLGLSGPRGGVWIRPRWCRELHHLLGFGADFLGGGGCFGQLGCFWVRESRMHVIVVGRSRATEL